MTPRATKSTGRRWPRPTLCALLVLGCAINLAVASKTSLPSSTSSSLGVGSSVGQAGDGFAGSSKGSTTPVVAPRNQTTTTTTTTSTSSKTNQESASKPEVKSATHQQQTQPQQQHEDDSQAIVEQQQDQQTDMSSMYVQIPIAEPGDNGNNQQQQHQQLGETGEGATKVNEAGRPSTWTGPWPKKFQIGYIKQSDLHQVLIESLKNEPFTVIGSGNSGNSGNSQPTSGGVKAGPSVATSPVQPAQKGAGVPNQPEVKSAVPQLATSQWPQTNGYQMFNRSPMMTSNHHHNNHQHQQQHQNFPRSNSRFFGNGANSYQQLSGRPHMKHQQQQQHQSQNPNQHLSHQFGMGPFGRHNQKPNMVPSAQGFANGQQLHFASLSQNMLNNQPMYLINNNNVNLAKPQHQEQLDLNPMQFPMPSGGQLFGAGALSQVPHRATKSDVYYSAWRPVTQQESASGAMIDSIDDGFNAPTEDSGQAANSMNRHPALNSYLGKQPDQPANSTSSNQQGGQSRLSPAMMASRMRGQANDQGSSSRSGTKGPLPATKVADSSVKLAGERRRGGRANGTDPIDATSGPTVSTINTGSVNASTTEPSSSTTSGTTSSPMTTTTTISTAEEITEPDSEVIDSTDTGTESPSSITTMSSSNTPANGAQTTPSPPGGSTNTQQVQQVEGTTGQPASTTPGTIDPADAEVATQSPAVQAAESAGLPGSSGDSSSSSTSSSTSGDGRETTSSSATNQEETTPAGGSTTSGSVSTSSNSAAEVEGSSSRRLSGEGVSDETLLAAAVRNGSDIGKTTSGGSSTPSSQRTGSQRSSAKRARSSDRLIKQQQQQAVGVSVKTANQWTRQAQQVSSGGSSKGQSASLKGISTKSRSSPSRSVSSSTPSGVSSTTGSGSSSTSSTTTTTASTTTAVSPSSTKPKVSVKNTRMANQRDRLQSSSQQQQQQQQQQPQVVSMSAAQAQSTAQTLASLLLSRCLTSSNCAHLLDVCSTKVANVQLDSSPVSSSAALTGAPSTAVPGWSLPAGLASSKLMTLAQSLQAERTLRQLPQWKETLDNIVDQESQSGYTLFLPSNDAIDKLPAAAIEALKSNPDLLQQLIELHTLESSAEVIDTSPSSRSKTKLIRGTRATLQVNHHRDRHITINGRRLVYANQPAPAGGRVHVIDGMLELPLAIGQSTSNSQAGQLLMIAQRGSGSSVASSELKNGVGSLDIMDTLKQCDKFDGFVTLAEGTGLAAILKQAGPMTVFVPSNEALRKIPDDELEVIKNNSTALREFLIYHVVNGSYFSQDLRDGQLLASMLDQRPIQVGIRVDGCSRRLVEANTSPMRRPDIAAKNGVIHILDWYLTAKDNEWCGDPTARFISSTSSSGTSSNNINQNSGQTAPTSTAERLQQLASDQVAGYATRMASLPANHKLSPIILDTSVAANSLSASSPASNSNLMASSRSNNAKLIEGHLETEMVDLMMDPHQSSSTSSQTAAVASFVPLSSASQSLAPFDSTRAAGAKAAA